MNCLFVLSTILMHLEGLATITNSLGNTDVPETAVNGEINNIKYTFNDKAIIDSKMQCIETETKNKHKSQTPRYINNSGKSSDVVFEYNQSDSDFNLPTCMNATLSQDEFVLDEDNKSLKVKVGYNIPMSFTRFDLSEDNSSASLCYPLSPQLLTCSKIMFTFSALPLIRFHQKNTSLHLYFGNRQVVQLGDYFLTADGNALVCSQQIRQTVTDIPRCHNVLMADNEYDELINGTWEIKTKKQIADSMSALTFGRANRNHKVNYCVPMDIRFVNCIQLKQLFPTDFSITRNRSLYYADDGVYIEVGDYFLLRGGRAKICADRSRWFSIDETANVIFIVCHFLSSGCLLLTALYQWFDSTKLNYHAKCLMNHIISLLLGNVSYAINVLLYPSDLTTYAPGGCYAIFVLTYLGVMCSFTWLNVLAFDVWYSFLTLQTSKYRCNFILTHGQRFIIYNIYAWSFPLILLIVVIIADQCEQVADALFVFPDIGSFCWFNNRHSQWFHYVPVSCMLATNLFFFFWTIVTIKFGVQDKEIVKQRNRNIVRGVLYFKLFAITCFSYLAGILVWSLGTVTGYTIWRLEYAALTALQGIVIFLVYICRKPNYDKLWHSVTVYTNKIAIYSMYSNSIRKHTDCI